MKYSYAALALSALAFAAPAPAAVEDCDETVPAVQQPAVQHPAYQAPPVALPSPIPSNDANCPKVECPAGGDKKAANFPIKFTSTFSIVATPDQVVNSTNVPTGGLEGAVGYYDFGLNSDLNLICYNITLVGVTGAYQSPADTATHIHQSALGRSGPPRIAFPNPTIVEGSNIRQSVGCLSGPFVTGIEAADNVTDTGSASGFTIAAIEANPSAFNADVHTADAVPGAVRGQFGAPLSY
ncbi:unnamed protein product [Zymoseptoria tritici ST99CH_3D1]|nr:unnamed protein product [Zymoseptoria tritici ST99CH_3D1]